MRRIEREAAKLVESGFGVGDASRNGGGAAVSGRAFRRNYANCRNCTEIGVARPLEFDLPE